MTSRMASLRSNGYFGVNDFLSRVRIRAMTSPARVPSRMMRWMAPFFFSSRRRHTIWTGDWSSDVCSSDLIHLYAGILTALYDRDRSGTGRLVEVAMQETVWPTLAASYDYYYRTGEIPPRTGNRQSGLNSAPYNVFQTADGYVAIHIVTEAHWQNLLKAMGRDDLADDP